MRSRTLRLPTDQFEQLAIVGGEIRILSQQLARPRDAREGIADLVGDARRHVAKGRHALRIADFLLHPPNRRDVVDGDHQGAQASLEERGSDLQPQPGPPPRCGIRALTILVVRPGPARRGP